MQPKPSTPLVIVSLVVILACLGLISSIAAAVVSWLDPCSAIGGIIILPFPLVAAIQQYRGTFRRVRGAARTTAILLFLAGGFAAFVVVSTLGESILDAGPVMMKKDSHLFLALLVGMLAVAVGLLLAAWLNLRWARSLPKPAADRPRLQFTLRELLGFMTVVAVVAALATVLSQSPPAEYAEHVAPADAPFRLPENATDVSYCRGFRGSIAFEFTTTEADFRQWVDSGIGSFESEAAGVPIVPIAKRVSIRRYNVYSADLTGPDSVTVTAGLEYSWRYQDRSVHAVFDSATNRAYYAASYH